MWPSGNDGKRRRTLTVVMAKEATGEALFVSESLRKNDGDTESLMGGQDNWPVGKCDHRSSGSKGLPGPPGHSRERCQEVSESYMRKWRGISRVVGREYGRTNLMGVTGEGEGGGEQEGAEGERGGDLIHEPGAGGGHPIGFQYIR